MRRIEARLGNTVFVAEDAMTPGTVRITRLNQDGRKEFYVPKELFEQYANDRMTSAISKIMRVALGDDE